MNTTMRNLAAAVLLSFAFAGFSAAAQAQGAPEMKKGDCLGCHGPVEALVKKNVQVKVEGGSVNPHKFVPHAEQNLEKFPECTVCHTPHAMPPPKGFKDKAANVEMCYSCHHNYTFEPCKKCHK